MEINREFYDGNTNIIYDGSAQQNIIIERLTDSLYAKIVANAEKYTADWDKSICPWKINFNADFMKAHYVLPYNVNSVWSVSTSPFYKERKKGYTFYLAQNDSNFQDRYDENKYFANNCAAWLSTLTNPDYDVTDTVMGEWTECKYGRLNPVIKFDYSKIFVVPTINGNIFNPNIENNFTPENIQRIGFKFYYKNYVGSNIELSMGAVSLNNEILQPSWSAYNTNCFNIDNMIDNGMFLTPYWVSHADYYNLSAICSREFSTNIPWRSSSVEFITGATGEGFYQSSVTGESAAATLNFFPNKGIYIGYGESELFSDYEAYYAGGTVGNFQYGVRRHLKSSVTYAELLDYLKTQCAYLGFRFLIDSTKIHEDIDSQYYYIPEINDAGVTTGNYYAANSTEAEQLNNYTWGNNIFEVTPYDGTDDDEDTDDNNYDDSNTTILNPIAGLYANDFQNSYVLDLQGDGNAAGLADVAAYLYYTAPTNNSEHDYLTNNPIDAIISCTMFPFNVSGTIPASGLPFVRFGKVVSDLKALGFISSQIQIIDCGECTYYPEYGVDDFRSYEPYCDAELILPYCGSVKISPTLIYCKTTNKNFHKISVKYIVDLISGACLACVFLDNLLIETSNGQIGLTVPVTGVRSADLQRDIFNKQTGLKQAANTGLSAIASTVFGAVGGMATGNGAASAKALVNGALAIDSANTSYKAAEYELKHIQVPFTVRAAASPLTDFANEQFPRMIIKRPVMLEYEPEVYAHSVGYACLITGKLSDYGAAAGETPQYIECTGLDLSGFSGTETEKARLKAALEGGIFI